METLSLTGQTPREIWLWPFAEALSQVEMFTFAVFAVNIMSPVAPVGR